MTRDDTFNHPTQPSGPHRDNEDARTQEGKKVIEDYANSLREMIRWIRKKLN